MNELDYMLSFEHRVGEEGPTSSDQVLESLSYRSQNSEPMEYKRDKKQKKDITGACSDWKESVKLGFALAKDTIYKYCDRTQQK